MTNSTSQTFSFFATTPKGLELLLVDELRALGAVTAAEKLAGVAFTGDLALAYKACLWSRLANRILLPLAEVPAATPEELYAGVQTIAWDEHLQPEGTLAVHLTSSQSQITHSLFGAQKVKDAIVDQFRDKYGLRPSVSKEEPDLSIHVYLHRDQATISLDLSGESLHRRSYRLAGGTAPLKENLAAAILLRAGWPTVAKEGGAFLDPMCGSATLLIEAAFMAADWAPGLKRSYFGFLNWKKHEPALWQDLILDAQRRAEQGVLNLPPIVGFDYDTEAIKIAFENIERAGLLGKVHVEKRDLSAFQPKYATSKQKNQPGLVVVNPPYGERLGEVEELQPLYTALGEKLKEAFVGWQAAVFTANPDLGKQMGLRAKRYYALFNGALPCKLLLFEVQPSYFVKRGPEADNERLIRSAKRAVAQKENGAIEMFINRLNKNRRHREREAKRQGLTQFRVYDADLPEYAFSIDLTQASAEVREYPAPKSIDPQKVLRRRQEVLAHLPEILSLPPQAIHFEILPRQKDKRGAR